jgi:mycofactocin system transcriptional regulator
VSEPGSDRRPSGARAGRPPSTSRAALSHLGLRLFIERGFDATTIDDIATAAGIGRRTFFRYFASKNDVAWGDFDLLLDRMRAHLRAVPLDRPMWVTLRDAIVEFNDLPTAEVPFHRERMELLLGVPTLVAHSTLRYDAWRQVIAEHVAQRLSADESGLEPQAIAWTSLAISLAAYEQWLRRADADLATLLHAAFDTVEASFGARAWPRAGPGR